MKKSLKKFYAGTLALLLVSGAMGSTISANESEDNHIENQTEQATKYTSDQSLVLDEDTDTYVVRDVNEVNKARSNYYVYKNLKFSVMTVKTQITVNSKTGKITNTSIIKSNDNYYALYDVSFNTSKTTAYFTVTVYEKAIIGSGLGKALGTLYSTVSA